MSLYFFLNIASFFIPFLYSFESRLQYYKRWKAVFSGIAITAVIFIVWDIFFTQIGVWHFNPRYHSGLEFFDLPIEEWLFFICIPYASIFIHYAFHYFLPHVKISLGALKIIYYLIIFILLPTIIFNFDKWYTSVNYIVVVLTLSYCYFNAREILQTFFITFLIILFPFGIVNGILTGSFIDQPVVYYNDSENLGIRLVTIPIEDIGYAFSMLLMSLVFIRKIESNKKDFKLE